MDGSTPPEGHDAPAERRARRYIDEELLARAAETNECSAPTRVLGTGEGAVELAVDHEQPTARSKPPVQPSVVGGEL
jgi:hypothetical protein